MTKIEELKAKWIDYTKNEVNIAKTEFEFFNNWINKVVKNIDEMTLVQYTDLINKNNSNTYFTNLIERKTEKCGKFRTASSYAYGVYREKSDSPIPQYKSTEQRGKPDFLNQEKAKLFFENNVRTKIVMLSNSDNWKSDIEPLDINYARKVAYMFNPGKLLPIYKKEVIEAIADFFDINNDDFNSNEYRATALILDQIVEKWQCKDLSNNQNDQKTNDFEFTQKLGSFLWEYFGKSFSLDHKNIIFYGAPGTGKTYAVQQGIKQRSMLEGDNETEVCVFAQFHPSYSYEDFIEGLKPVVENGSITLKLQSGQFKKLCKEAMDSLKISRETNSKITKFYFIADEINRAELSRVLGEVLVCLEESKRIDFDDTGNVTTGLYLKSQYSHLYQNDEDALLTICGERYFGIPSNLYFIGTMNDIDRSIDSFDFALRRRFVWKRMDCDYEVIGEKFINEKNDDHSSYIDICKKLNTLIAEDWGLGKAYQIGHAYFMDINNISNTSLNNLFDSKIGPLLAEYLRAEYPANEIETKLKQAKNIFSLPKTNKQGASQTTLAGEND